MPAAWHISTLEIISRLLLAVLLGGAVGAEREWRQHSAGLRTHIMVCLGAATLVLVSIYGFANLQIDSSNHPSDPSIEPNLLADPSRLAAQVVSGVGFLGAGVIFAKGKTVFGLTTAVSIWIVCAVGLCVGTGFYFCAIMLTILTLIVQLVFKKIQPAKKQL